MKQYRKHFNINLGSETSHLYPDPLQSNHSQPGSFSEDTETFFCNVASVGASRDSSWNQRSFQELQEFLGGVRLLNDFNWPKDDLNWFTVSAGIIDGNTKVRLFTVPCSIILFSSEGVKKKRIWIYS